MLSTWQFLRLSVWGRHIGTSDRGAATRATRETAHNLPCWNGASSATTRATLKLRTRSHANRSRTYLYRLQLHTRCRTDSTSEAPLHRPPRNPCGRRHSAAGATARQFQKDKKRGTCKRPIETAITPIFNSARIKKQYAVGLSRVRPKAKRS
jgi:hypothetical protein